MLILEDKKFGIIKKYIFVDCLWNLWRFVIFGNLRDDSNLKSYIDNI